MSDIKKIFYWSLVDLPCCIWFWCTAEWLSHTYIYSFSYSFPLWFITGYRIWSPVLYSRTLLLFHSMYSRLHMPTPNSQSIPPLQPLPAWQPQSVLYVCKSISVSRCVHILFVYLLVYLFIYWLHLEVCEPLIPPGGIEPGLQQWKHRVLSTGPPGKSHLCYSCDCTYYKRYHPMFDIRCFHP